MDQCKSKDRYEFLDLSDVDDDERTRLSTALQQRQHLQQPHYNPHQQTDSKPNISDDDADERTAVIPRHLSEHTNVSCVLPEPQPDFIPQQHQQNSDSRMFVIQNWPPVEAPYVIGNYNQYTIESTNCSTHSSSNNISFLDSGEQSSDDITPKMSPHTTATNNNTHQHQSQAGTHQPAVHQPPIHMTQSGAGATAVYAQHPASNYIQHAAATQVGGAMYQMLPSSMPGNVYVGNVTANVNLHGYMPHPMSQYLTATAPPFIPASEMQQQAVPVYDPQTSQSHISSHIRSNGVRRGRQSRGNSGSGTRREYRQPNIHTNGGVNVATGSHELVDQQMLPQGSYATPYYMNPYTPAYYPATHQLAHPTAQTATGTPLFLAGPIPGYTLTQPHMYQYHPNLVYPTMMPSEYAMVDDKGSEVEQMPDGSVMMPHHTMWQPQLHYEYPPPDQQIISEEYIHQQQPPPNEIDVDYHFHQHQQPNDQPHHVLYKPEEEMYQHPEYIPIHGQPQLIAQEPQLLQPNQHMEPIIDQSQTVLLLPPQEHTSPVHQDGLPPIKKNEMLEAVTLHLESLQLASDGSNITTNDNELPTYNEVTQTNVEPVETVSIINQSTETMENNSMTNNYENIEMYNKEIVQNQEIVQNVQEQLQISVVQIQVPNNTSEIINTTIQSNAVTVEEIVTTDGNNKLTVTGAGKLERQPSKPTTWQRKNTTSVSVSAVPSLAAASTDVHQMPPSPFQNRNNNNNNVQHTSKPFYNSNTYNEITITNTADEPIVPNDEKLVHYSHTFNEPEIVGDLTNRLHQSITTNTTTTTATPTELSGYTMPIQNNIKLETIHINDATSHHDKLIQTSPQRDDIQTVLVQPTNPPQTSWAGLFNTSKIPSPLSQQNPIIDHIPQRPVATVPPYERSSDNVIPTPPGALSYSAASVQGMGTNNNSSLIQTVNMSGGFHTNGAHNQVKKNASFSRTLPSIEHTVKPFGTSTPNKNITDESSLKLGEFFSKYKVDNSPISLRPRGLTNRSTYCYINAILQALVACPPFYNLIKSIPLQSANMRTKTNTPTIDAMSELIREFSHLPPGSRLYRRDKNHKKEDVSHDLVCDPAFEPTAIHKLWNSTRTDNEGRQEDAEEFLGYVLNKLNDEMLELKKLVEKPPPPPPVASPIVSNGETQSADTSDNGDEWKLIGNRNKGTVTRTTDFGSTPLSDIFRGELRSRLQREGDHSTDVMQPFFTIQLNIEKAASVEEAFVNFVGKDQLEGVTCSKTNQQVMAWQQMTLEKLPVILVLHLKWFDYKLDGCTKILKTVEFPIELKLDSKILSSKKYGQKQKQYRLYAVVYHDGKEASKGHYITDVYHTGYLNWLRYDDSSVKPVSENSVLHPRAPRAPYLLYYRRCDTITNFISTNTGQHSK